jgi:archaellum component FlaC
MNRKIYIALAAAIAVLLASCETLGGPAAKATPDEKAIAKGAAAWNDKAPSTAKPYWNTIKDKATRDAYTGYVDKFDSGSKSLADAAAAKPGDEARILASYEKAQKAFAGIPKDLALPEDTRASGNTLAEGRMRSLIAADKLSYARELGKGAVETFGGSEAISSMNAEIDVISNSRKREAEADATLQKAREVVVFDEKITSLDAASGAYAKAETLLADEAGRVKVSKNQGVAREASRLRKKRQDVAIEREKILREQAYSFKDRIGEEFARVPEKSKVGTMTLEELLEHQESVKANVQAVYNEMTQFADRYPQAIDSEMITEVEEQKKDLDAKIAQVNTEIRTAKEIASRGKVVMPIMIGLFNPQPGSTAEAKKSRPAVFQATGAKKNEYWWGMISIPKGTMNDLVVTVNDSRTVRVFTDNTKSGTLIEKNKLKDLVNRGYKVGNSWPVLNAGSQLTTDKYFFEIQEGKTPDYEGEVVVYSSFIMRMR